MDEKEIKTENEEVKTDTEKEDKPVKKTVGEKPKI